MISKLSGLLKMGLTAMTPTSWVGYVGIAGGAATLALFAAWWLYSTGLEAGRNECAAAALAEQSRQIDINDAERRKADALAVTILNEKEKRDAENRKLDEQATAAAAGADAECFDADSVRRLNRIR